MSFKIRIKSTQLKILVERLKMLNLSYYKQIHNFNEIFEIKSVELFGPIFVKKSDTLDFNYPNVVLVNMRDLFMFT
ncbi:hypothetical protein BpHYR1_026635 [Brachionus plicatilis]|uniref:Uncharacterized protein n=1 Tax=Brachionus plicatilis TaxID=10195 RepID=A0A3M7PC65_BRAPC|nr:hypothetical protein BpHYR1_026635 [Brachionus plicatilis]